MSNKFPIQNGREKGDAESPLLFNFALEYTISEVQVNHERMKLNGGAHQLLVYPDYVILFGENIFTTQKNTEALLVDSKESQTYINAEKNRKCQSSVICSIW